MKAIQIHAYGTADLLRLDKVPVPTANENEVVVKVFAASVNHIDYLKASGALKQFYPLSFPWIPGRDFAGIVERVGAGVTAFQPGDQVYGDAVGGGTYAEYVAVDQNAIAHKPGTLSYLQAASVPVSAVTALQALFEHGGLRKGQTVAIRGAAGSVGMYAVQMAKMAGARVISIAAQKYADLLHRLGAETVINSAEVAFDTQLKNVDVFLDLVGGPDQQRCFKVLKSGGILITTTQPPDEALATKFGVHAKMIHQHSTTAALTEIAGMFERNALQTCIARTYSLEQAAAAWLEIQKNFGGNNAAPHVNGKHVIAVI